MAGYEVTMCGVTDAEI